MLKQTITIITLFILLSNFLFCQTESWTIYNTSNSDIPDNWVWGLDIDNDQNVWIGTVDHGLAKFDGTSWTIYNTSNSDLPSNTCFVTAFESNGNVWEGSMAGVSMFDGSEWTSQLTGGDMWDIEIDSDNNKWVTTMSYGLAFYNNSTWTYYTSAQMGTNCAFAIAIDNSGVKWIGTDNGLVKYDGTNWTIYNTGNSPIPNDNVISLEIDINDNIWIGTGGSGNTGGLAKFDRENWTVYTDDNSGLPSNYITDLMPDSEGNIWISTGGSQPGGLVKFDGDSNWKIYNSSNSDIPASDNRVQSVAMDSAGCVWVATSDGIGVLCFETNDIKTKHNDQIFPVQIYPNPNKGVFTIEFSDISSENHTIELLRMPGQLIDSRKVSGGTTTEQFDVSESDKGIYYVRIITGDAVKVEKIIVQ